MGIAQTSETENNADRRLIEQYKAYLQDVGNIGARHASTNALYVSILSALLVFLSLTGGERPALGAIGQTAQATVGIVAILLCAAWFAQLKSFGYLYKAKFDVLRALEKDGSLYECFQKELDLLDPKFFRFTALERGITLFLCIPFLVIVINALFR